ncbi:MAG: nucleotidyltransferase family protein [Paraclostridium sp.]|uniref:nucleotidyltransferase family protein n=1 Tax=Paraclostridium sp. TaxID=2023273 RepID=UPI003F2FF6AF
MTKPALVVMAAGMGSRYGGLKQIDPIGPNGEIIIEYSIYDAIKAGFSKVVFVIKEEMKDTFRDKVGKKIEHIVETKYVSQNINFGVPKNFDIPKERIKPWGTGHAIYCCKEIIDGPFAVINADDFYGQSTYKLMYDYLSNNKNQYSYAMAGFVLENTLTENGTVARGICKVDDNDNLVSITERTSIKKFKDSTKYMEDNNRWIDIKEGSIVSMNIWGFRQTIFKELENDFVEFLNKSKENILKSEFYIPSVVDKMVKDKKANVKVLVSREQWYGVTYKEDKENVCKNINRLMGNVYPDKLWEG